VTATLTFHPLGNADCTRLDLADGKKLLIDYADMRNPDDRWDRRIDLPAELRSDLRAAQRDYYDVVGYTHLDDDHCCGSGDFFWLEHALKYQDEDRVKISELWVPAGAILRLGRQRPHHPPGSAPPPQEGFWHPGLLPSDQAQGVAGGQRPDP
jgi:hypothetical protein